MGNAIRTQPRQRAHRHASSFQNVLNNHHGFPSDLPEQQQILRRRVHARDEDVELWAARGGDGGCGGCGRKLASTAGRAPPDLPPPLSSPAVVVSPGTVPLPLPPPPVSVATRDVPVAAAADVAAAGAGGGGGGGRTAANGTAPAPAPAGAPAPAPATTNPRAGRWAAGRACVRVLALP